MQVDNRSLWQHIAKLRPRLRGDVQLYPQVYRGKRWYVLHDLSAAQFMRLNERAYAVLGRLDGDLTLEEILEHANEDDTDHPLSTDEITALIGQLNSAEVLRGGLPIDAQDLFRQYKSQQRRKRQRTLMNPLSIKIPLLDPDRFLTKLTPLARVLFSWIGLWFWVLVVFSALLLGLAHAGTLASDIANIKLSSTQLISLWLIYPVVKGLHELGHSLALKAWGAEVHEIGVNLLVFMPVPYVDATASWSFRDKWRRMVVGSAGIFVELFLASLALFLWLVVEPGLLKDAALNVILIATLSTLLFNGNPLLRYDGYFVLEDWLEIPNLATRAKQYYYYLIQRYLLKMEHPRSPVTAEGEVKWFLLYGLLSPVYSLSIMLGITFYLADSFLVIGTALAVWVVMMRLIIPLVKGVRFLTVDKAVASHRKRGVALLVITSVVIIAVLSIPVSTITKTQGVVWTQQGGQVIAGTSGFVTKTLVPSGSEVKKGEPILQLVDYELMARYKGLRSKVDELNAQILEQWGKDRVKTAMLQDDLRAVETEFGWVSEQMARLTVHSHIDGRFVSAVPGSLVGRFVHQGEVLGHIIAPEDLIIRAVVPQSRIGLLQTYETSAQYILADRLGTVFESQIVRQTPKATTRVPSPAFGTAGGGTLAIDPDDESGMTLLSPVFQIDLSLPKELRPEQIGGRVYVRLDHGALPIGEQLALDLNQLFLRHFYAR